MQGTEPTGGYRYGHYVVDPAQRRLRRDGKDVPLEAKVFDLILLLLENRARALGKQEVVQALWGHRPISDAALSQLVYKARRALDDDGKRGDVIRTVYGRGLQWVAPVTALAGPAPAAPATPATPAEPEDAPASRGRRWPRLALGLGAALALVASGLWLIPPSKAPPVPAPPRLAMLPTENATGDPTLDWVGHGLAGLMTSLLGDSRGVDALDALQIARIWDYTPPPGRSRAEHARYVAHADILVGSRLRKLADRLYELDVHVDAGAAAPAADLAITGDQPGTLAMQAVERIRHTLHLEPPTRVPGARPADAYLAETFARGLDEAMHGRWMQAKPYFRLCAQNDAGFLPARLRLGQAQVNTDEPDQGEQTLQQALAGARAQGNDALAANSLLQLASLALVRHRHADALALLRRAAPLARQVDEPGLEAAIALKSANVAARLHQLALAREQLSRARGLIGQHQLRELDADLHNSEGFVAEAQGDLAADEAANRAALAASEAIGNERNARGDAYNLALVLAHEGKNAEAMRLFAHSYRRARGEDPWLAFASGDNLAIALLNAGLSEKVEPLAGQLLAAGRQQHNPVWQSLALMLRAGSRWYANDAATALAECRAASALIDPIQDPALALAIEQSEASAALLAQPGAVAGIARHAIGLIEAQKQPGDFGYERQLFQAMAASAAGRPAQVRTALKAAAAGAHPGDPTADQLRTIGLTIALRDQDRQAAAIALAGFEPAVSDSADALRLYAQWEGRQGVPAAQARATARLAILRKDALAALATEPLDEGLAAH